MSEVDAIVVGAGFAGLRALHTLRNLGLRVTVLEAGDQPGGVWNYNGYPGARCDVESFDYSYRFDPELRAGMALDRALRAAARDPALHQPRRGAIRPAQGHRVPGAR